MQGWIKAIFGETFIVPRIQTERLILRSPKSSDVGALFSYATDPQVSRYVLWSAHRTPADSAWFIRKVRSENRQGNEMTLTVEEKSSGQMIGTMGFVSFNHQHHLAEVGYSFSKKSWGKGYATEALTALIRYGFEVLELNRIEGVCDVRNPASGRVMEKCGLQYEGTLRGKALLKGDYADVKQYAILKKDYYKNR